MLRCLITLALVALLSCLISRAERVHGAGVTSNDWVRTADGWESRLVLEPPTAPAPQVHPALVAAFQAGASLFCLLAFPARVAVASPELQTAGRIVRRRRPVREPATIG